MNDQTSEPDPLRPATARTTVPPRPATRDEVTLTSLWRTTFRGLWIIVLVTVLVLVLTAAWLHVRTPAFAVSATVAPAARDLAAAGQLVRELQEFAGLATFAQVPERVDHVSTLDRFFELIGSVRLATRLQEDHGLLQRVFPDQWDAGSQRWRPPRGTVARLKQTIAGFLGSPAWSPPGPAHLAGYLEAEIEVHRSIGGLFSLQLDHQDPALAEDIMTAVIATADDLLRQETLERIDAQVAHLENAIGGDLPAARRRALEDLLDDHYQTQALLEVDRPFAVDIVSPPAIDPVPVGLGPLLIVALAGVVGVILGLFVVFLRDALKRNLD